MAIDIFPGRYTAVADRDFVVFLIGMRVNRFWQFKKWLPVARAMQPMVETLYRYPEKGFLAAEFFFNFNGPTTFMVSYWESFEDIERFARSPSEPHLEPWKQFRQNVGDDGTVGIWHETYQVRAGEHESIYGNMPRFGLANAFDHVKVGPPRDAAGQRIRQPTTANGKPQPVA